MRTNVEDNDMTNSRSKKGVSRTEAVLLTGLGLLLIIYAVARWTDVFTFTSPAIVYFILGIVLLLWGVSLNRRS
jgi:uncharacterized membrane protein YidH (DUF202 family)